MPKSYYENFAPKSYYENFAQKPMVEVKEPMKSGADVVDYIIGMPPAPSGSIDQTAENMRQNMMPVMRILPSKPQFEAGLSLFQLVDDFETYNKILKAHHVKLSQDELPIIKIAFLADNFPTDNFANEYGENFIQGAADFASKGIGEVNQMLGSRTISGSWEEVKGMVKEMGGLGEIAAGGMQRLTDITENLADKAESIPGGNTILNRLNQIAAGARVDFPGVWKNSSYAPSYTCTVRLWNPAPGNQSSTNKYIICPLIVLLALGLPRALKGGDAYNWPFFHQINVPGLWSLDAGAISNISVIKGGEQHKIAFNQALQIVDVRMEFTSLYNSILIEEEGKTSNPTRPTLRKYAEALGHQGKWDELRKIKTLYPSSFHSKDNSIQYTSEVDTPKFSRASMRLPNPQVDIQDSATSRVTTDDEDSLNDLLDSGTHPS